MNKFSLYCTAFISTLIVFCVVDFIWLTILMRDFYNSRLGSMMLERPNLVAAAAFYLLYVVGVIVFGIKPGIDANDWKKCALLNALLGVVAYATYDLSNLATLKGWSVDLTIVDIVWGGVVTMISGTAGYFATQKVKRMMA